MQVKGLEMSAYAPRAFTGMGLSFATTSRGADHNKAFTVAAEFLGVLGNYDRYAMEGKPHLVKTMQDSTCIIDSLIMCMFTVDLGIGIDLYAKCAALPTGMKFTEDDVYTVGERINTVERLFNIKEGFTRADDNLPRALCQRSGAVGSGAPHPGRDGSDGRVLRRARVRQRGGAYAGLAGAIGHLARFRTLPALGRGGTAMRVGVTLFGHYSRLLPPESRNGRASLEFEEATTVGDVLDRLQIPPEGRTYVTVNGTHVGQDTILSEDDEIRVIVPLGGG